MKTCKQTREKMIFNPSLACADLVNLERDINELESTGFYELIHIDLMDGHFVPNLCFSTDMLRQVKKVTKLPIDLHMMVTNPEQYIVLIGEIGVECLSFHVEATKFPIRLASDIRNRGMKAGIIFNPSTPVANIVHILPYVDRVTFMSIEPGFAGPQFIEEMFNKLAELIAKRESLKFNFQISVDGGIGMEEAKKCTVLGVDILIVGYKTVFKPEGITKATENFFKEYNNFVESLYKQ